MKSDMALIWIDLEMTGLDPKIDCILEIATIVTDSELNILEEGPSFVIHQSDLVLNQMNDWCKKTHAETGLSHDVKKSDITLAFAEQKTLSFLKQYVEIGVSPMCGNTVSQDRRFLEKYMPELHDFFHYRHIDVSTLKELVKRWQPELQLKFVTHTTHRAMDDIRDSIHELKLYREHFIGKNTDSIE
ncbi:MAG: oligoribonuclease [Endozoicomonadaceae bacterium]|nr:oligoribonuclease [Endozoicomonadaceae bacterium]